MNKQKQIKEIKIKVDHFTLKDKFLMALSPLHDAIRRQKRKKIARQIAIKARKQYAAAYQVLIIQVDNVTCQHN